MRNFLYILLISLAAGFFSACASDSLVVLNQSEEDFNYVLSFTNAESMHWKAGFADYPVGAEDQYALSHSYATVPEEAGEKKPSFFISGHNHSDDLFMYLYRKIDGLEPETIYQISFALELASNAPRNSIGIGGSPGASVYLKAGAFAQEPERVQEEVNGVNYWKTRFDTGNLTEAGEGLQLLGNIGTDLQEFRYSLIQRSGGNPINVETNEKGELWLLVGTDSDFEGTTSLYYTSVKVKAKKAVLAMEKNSLD